MDLRSRFRKKRLSRTVVGTPLKKVSQPREWHLRPSPLCGETVPPARRDPISQVRQLDSIRGFPLLSTPQITLRSLAFLIAFQSLLRLFYSRLQVFLIYCHFVLHNSSSVIRSRILVSVFFSSPHPHRFLVVLCYFPSSTLSLSFILSFIYCFHAVHPVPRLSN